MNIKQNLKKNGLVSLGSKRLCKESFEDLEFSSNWIFQTRAALSHKMAALKFFCEITQKSSFNSQRRIVKGAVSSLRQFLATESPWKIMKNAFYFINKLSLVLANQILLMLCILIKPNVWYSWGLKILAINYIGH